MAPLFQCAKDSSAMLSATAKVAYDTGVIDITFTRAPPEGTEIAVQVEINIERNPSLIPVINCAMRKYEVRPSQYVIASETIR
uniref:Uncharacterized protein n=1 Tax=Salmonella sp. TaxID=599 RepID=A0A482ETL9_SALSP|nr:hypothetical protein [Salmonella sp.]QBM91557.1 hypothetical protein NNIBIDOC_00231 [Salmonella sp.]